MMEYSFIEVSGYDADDSNKLNIRAAEGWRVVGTLSGYHTGYGTVRGRVLLERERIEEEPDAEVDDYPRGKRFR